MYIFPGLGFGAWLCESDRVSNKMIVNAALALAESVTDEELARGQVYPSISRIRDIEAQIATRVIETAIEEVCKRNNSIFKRKTAFTHLFVRILLKRQILAVTSKHTVKVQCTNHNT